jgi:chloramphenicol 3-O-phosphotransferase
VSPESRGRIILLNGASSSGKSSIGRALLPLLPDPWFLVPVDAISGMRSTVHTRELDDGEVGEMLRRTRAGYHRTDPEEAARVVAAALPGVPVPKAFDRMRVRRRSSQA